LGPTETRSRDEWLAEVKRRGGRLRRRRRLTMAFGSVLALVLPVSALATFLGNPDSDVRQVVAGPAPSTAPSGGVIVDSPVDGPGVPVLTEEAPTTTTTQPQLRVEPVHDRTQPPTGGSGSAARADDAVVQPAPTTTVPSNNALTATPSTSPTTTVPPAATQPPAAPCVAKEFVLSVGIDKRSYGPGETISGSSTLAKMSDGTCQWPDWWVEIKILNDAGKDVMASGQSLRSSTENHAEPGEPGAPYTAKNGPVLVFTFDWANCALSSAIVPADPQACLPFPPGTYTAVAEWVGPGSGPSARMPFQLHA
jgi:hypothetical protein